MRQRLNPKVIEHLSRKNSEVLLAAALRLKQVRRELADLRRPAMWLIDRGVVRR